MFLFSFYFCKFISFKISKNTNTNNLSIVIRRKLSRMMDPEWEIRKVRWPEPDALSGPLSANGVTYGRIRFLIGAPQKDQTLARNRGRGMENLHGREPRGINFWGSVLGGKKNRDTGDGWWKNRTWLIFRKFQGRIITWLENTTLRTIPFKYFFPLTFFSRKVTEWKGMFHEMSRCVTAPGWSIFSNRELEFVSYTILYSLYRFPDTKSIIPFVLKFAKNCYFFFFKAEIEIIETRDSL